MDRVTPTWAVVAALYAIAAQPLRELLLLVAAAAGNGWQIVSMTMAAAAGYALSCPGPVPK
jgi:hypothetical protein